MSLTKNSVKYFKVGSLYKHKQWKNIGIMIEKTIPSDHYVKIEGVIYNINLAKISECEPVSLDYDDEFKIPYIELEDWIELHY